MGRKGAACTPSSPRAPRASASALPRSSSPPPLNGADDGARTMADNERLWRIWWLWGIPVAWATAALIVLAESLRNDGFPRWVDFLDVLRLPLYWWWLQRA